MSLYSASSLRRVIYRLVVFAVALEAIPVHAQETICLKNGFCIGGISHEILDGAFVVRTGSGTLQFAEDQVQTISTVPVPAVQTATPVTMPEANTHTTTSAEEVIFRAALHAGLEPDFVRSVAMVESGLRQSALSQKGAIGLMQLMPQTANQLGVDAKVADQNAKGGAAFLRSLLLKYRGDSVLALAAYNAGPGAVERYKGVPPFFETRQYVLKVLKEYNRQQQPRNSTVAQAH